jgi:hypothetical protein
MMQPSHQAITSQGYVNMMDLVALFGSWSHQADQVIEQEPSN